MVVMITPVAFTSIGYKTYIIFAVINAFIVPVTYFFYPETAYRSLEEMGHIFHKTKSWTGVVGIARDEPRMYGKHGEQLINYKNTSKHQENAARALRAKGIGAGKEQYSQTEDVESG